MIIIIIFIIIDLPINILSPFIVFVKPRNKALKSDLTTIYKHLTLIQTLMNA